MISSWSDPDLQKSPEQLCSERLKRLEDAASLCQPDRIPVMVNFSHALAEWGGVTHKELYDNPVKYQALLEKFGLEIQADATQRLFGMPAVSAALGDQMTRWPGYGIAENCPFQFTEKEFMKADEYDDFLFDPTDWTIRKYIPRAFSNLSKVSMLPNLATYAMGYYAINNILSLGSPQMGEVYQAIGNAIQLMGKSLQDLHEGSRRMSQLGLPAASFFSGTVLMAPYDFMSNTLRGMRGIMLDLHKRPEKLLAAEEKSLKFQLDYAIQKADMSGFRAASIYLHRGSDGFLSIPQFEKFYWAQLKEMIEELVSHNIRPYVFYEGVWNQRLKYLADLPKGKTIGGFQNSDLSLVKEIVGDTMCIVGGMPVSLLTNGTVEEVRNVTQDLCRKLGKDGGFIMYTNISELEGTKKELVKAWVDATKEFGIY